MPRLVRPFGPAILASAALALAPAICRGQEPAPAPLPEAQVAALDRISADSLRGHLSFLASDLLEGRDTPSRGQDLAAEYIAAQFRRAGLEEVGDAGYFQTARWELSVPDASTFRLEVANAPDSVFRVAPDAVSRREAGPIDLNPTEVYKLDLAKPEFDPAAVAGKVILVGVPDLRKADGPARRSAQLALNGLRSRLTRAKVAWLVAVSHVPGDATGLGSGRLIDPTSPEGSEGFGRPGPGGEVVGTITVHDPRMATLFDGLPLGPSPGTTVGIKLGPPTSRPVTLRNVAGLLRGSDPELGKTVVMVTAHYDHIGIGGSDPAGDRIYNGANDDGSGTVSVIELAGALGTLKPEARPRRSVLFVAFFGEEHGLLGSRYYGRHPLVPVAQTVADLNLEQVGRTDSSEGPQVGTAGLTGFGYSDVSTVLACAGEAEGVRVYKHPRNSDAFFGRSDNQALADLGVPAHTLCVAFEYPDYHGVADHWDNKVDYPNMARVDRAVARALLTIANDPSEPRWTDAPLADRYRRAWADRHPAAKP